MKAAIDFWRETLDLDFDLDNVLKVVENTLRAKKPARKEGGGYEISASLDIDKLPLPENESRVFWLEKLTLEVYDLGYQVTLKSETGWPTENAAEARFMEIYTFFNPA